MSDLFHYIGVALMIIGLVGMFICVLLAIFFVIGQKFSAIPKILGSGIVLVVILFIGIAISSFTEKNYWDRTTETDEKANEKIVKNIEKNQQAAAKAHQESVKEQQKAIEEEMEQAQSEQVQPEQTSYDEQEVYNSVINYENSLMEAINSGNFQIVEPYLLPDSHLYISQADLVDRLFNKGITEQLNMFNVESIQKVAENKFEATVYEEVSIQNSGKEQVNKYRWTYSVQNVDGQYLLSDIRE